MKKHPALHALELAIAHIRVSSKLHWHRGKPGEVIESLPSEEREHIKELKSEMFSEERFEPWMSETLNIDYQSLKEEIKKFDERIENAKHNWSRRLLMRHGYGTR